MGAIVGIGGAISETMSKMEAASAQMSAAETSRILEAAFFDDEVEGIIAESARLVGGAEAEAGARGVKSTTGTAAARVAEIRRAGARELRTAAQETVLVRYGLAQAGSRAKREVRGAMVQGGFSALGHTASGLASAGTVSAGGGLSARNASGVPGWVGLL